MNIMLKRELNPTMKSKYDEIKRLFNYIDQEIENINLLICEKNKVKQE